MNCRVNHCRKHAFGDDDLCTMHFEHAFALRFNESWNGSLAQIDFAIRMGFLSAIEYNAAGIICVLPVAVDFYLEAIQ